MVLSAAADKRRWTSAWLDCCIKFWKGTEKYENPIRVTEAEYENRKTGEKATGCTVLIHGEIKAVLDQLMKENPEIKSYGQALAGIVDLGVSVLESQAQAVQARAAEAQENASGHKE